MIRPTEKKRQERLQLERDLAAFINGGGVIKTLAGFGMVPTIQDISLKKQFESNYAKRTSRNTKREIPSDIKAEMDRAILNGETLVSIRKRLGVTKAETTRARLRLEGQRREDRSY